MPLPHRTLVAVLAVATALTAPAAAHAAFGFSRTDVPLSSGPAALAVGDVDGRNGPDVVAITYPGSKLVVLLNHGDGTFAAPVDLPACDTPSGLQLGDVTTTGSDLATDGRLDVVTTCISDPGSNRRVARLAGNGAGGFGAATISPDLTLGPILVDEDPVHLANVRTDGGPPLLFFPGDFYDSAHFVTRHVLCMSWNWAAADCLSPTDGFPYIGGPIASGRLNGTPRDQIMVGGGSKGLVVFGIADNIPNGPSALWTFSEHSSGANDATNGGARHLRFADATGDGSADIIASRTGGSDGSFSLMPWGALGLSDTPERTFTTGAGAGPTIVGDFDGDGHPDVLAVTNFGRALAHAGDGAGGFGGGTDVPLIGYQNPAYAGSVQAEPADVNCDGRPDAVVADATAGSIEILRNTVSPGSATCTTPGGTGPGGGGPLPPGTPVSPVSGIRAVPAALTVGLTGLLGLGTASNPPTAVVDLALRVTVAGAAGTGAARRSRTVRIGAAHIVIPRGKTRKLTVKLNAAGRRLLKRSAKVRATLTLAATGTDGRHETAVRTVTVRRRRR